MEEFGLLNYTEIFRYVANYLLAFIVSLLGVFTNEIMHAVKKDKKVRYSQIIPVSIFCGLLINMIQDRFKFDFSLFMFICFMLGIWGSRILQILASNRFFIAFFRNIMKVSASNFGDIGEASAKTLDELEIKEKENKKEE